METMMNTTGNTVGGGDLAGYMKIEDGDFETRLKELIDSCPDQRPDTRAFAKEYARTMFWLYVRAYAALDGREVDPPAERITHGYRWAQESGMAECLCELVRAGGQLPPIQV